MPWSQLSGLNHSAVSAMPLRECINSRIRCPQRRRRASLLCAHVRARYRRQLLELRDSAAIKFWLNAVLGVKQFKNVTYLTLK
jgi:hypothetical protein